MTTHHTIYPFLSAVLLWNGLAVRTANADTTYTYTGSTGFTCGVTTPINPCGEGTIENEYMQATLVFSAPLDGSLDPWSGDPTLIYWSLSDDLGYLSLSSTLLGSTPQTAYQFLSANILTDDSGDIVNASTISVSTEIDGQCQGACGMAIGGLAGDSLAYDIPCNACVLSNREPGEWTATPEPSAGAMSVLCLLAGCLWRRLTSSRNPQR